MRYKVLTTFGYSCTIIRGTTRRGGSVNGEDGNSIFDIVCVEAKSIKPILNRQKDKA